MNERFLDLIRKLSDLQNILAVLPGANVNSKNEDGENALFFIKDPVVAWALHDRGLANLRNCFNKYPESVAIKRNDLQMLRFFIETKGKLDISGSDFDKDTSIQVLRFLILNNSIGKSMFETIVAKHYDNEKRLCDLLELGKIFHNFQLGKAKVSILEDMLNKDASIETLKTIIYHKGTTDYEAILNVFLEKDKPELLDILPKECIKLYNKSTIFKIKSLETYNHMVSKGLEISLYKKYFSNIRDLMVYSSKKLCNGLLKILVENGFEIDAKLDEYGSTALRYIDNFDILKDYVENGANVNHLNIGKDILFGDRFNKEEKIDILKLFIKHGFDINQKISIDEVKDIDIMNILVKNGADITCLNKCIDSLVKLFKENDCIEEKRQLLDTLLEKGLDPNARSLKGNALILFINDIEMAKSLIKYGADVNSISINNNDVLYYNGYKKELCKFYIENGINVKFVYSDNKTILFNVFDPELTKLAIKYGADVNHKDNNGDTAIIDFAKYIDEHKQYRVRLREMLEIYVDAGLDDINHINKEGKCLLFFAIKFGDINSIRYLLDKGADPNILDVKELDTISKEIIIMLYDYGMNHIVETMLTLNKKDKGYFSFIEDFIKSGIISADYVFKSGTTLLNFVLIYEEYKLAEFLVNNGADVNQKLSSGKKIIYLVKSSPETALLFFQKGADIHFIGKDVSPPILRFAVSGYSKVIQFLIEKGADVNSLTLSGSNILHKLIQSYAESKSNNSRDIIEVILKTNVDLNHVNDEGYSPFSLALKHKDYVVCKMLADAGCFVPDNIPIDLKIYLERDLRLTLDIFGYIENGREDHANTLLDYGFDVNTVNKLGENALFNTVAFGSMELLKRLLDLGANINHVNNQGENVLFTAVKFERIEMIQLLIEKGININHINNKQLCVSCFAIRNKNIDLFEYLVSKGAVPCNLAFSCTDDPKIKDLLTTKMNN